jgi:hypothetical protein
VVIYHPVFSDPGHNGREATLVPYCRERGL